VNQGGMTININGVTDPKEVARQVNKEIDNRNMTAIKNLRKGIIQ
jgi:hypothetical protein